MFIKVCGHVVICDQLNNLFHLVVTRINRMSYRLLTLFTDVSL